MIAWQVAYARARNLEKKKDWEAAVAAYTAILERGERTNAKVLFRLGHCQFQQGDFQEAEKHISRAVEIDPEQAAWHYRLGFIRERSKDWVSAHAHYSKALTLEPENTSWKHRLEATERGWSKARVREKVDNLVAAKAPTWYVVDVLQGPFEHGELDLALTVRLADGYFTLDRFERAAVAYEAAAALEPQNAWRPFNAGRSWMLAGEAKRAAESFQTAVTQDRKLNAKHLGIGVFFQHSGLWEEAAAAYADSSRLAPQSSELHYRCGVALQKVYNWEASITSFESAVQLAPGHKESFYRLGLSHERLGNIGEASAAYAMAIADGDSVTSYWSYRLGCVLEKLGEYSNACRAFENSANFEPEPGRLNESELNRHLCDRLERSLKSGLMAQSADRCFQVGQRAERLGSLEIAARAYRASIDRSEAHQPLRYYRLGQVLAKAGLFGDAAKSYREMRLFGRAFGVDTQQYLKNKQRRLSMLYLEFSETTSVDSSIILYESGHGAGAAGNPLQIWRTLITDSRFSGAQHVWVVNDRKAIPAELQGREDVIFVARESDLYLKYLALAAFLINDNTFPPYFIRKEGQKYLNTWHGTPLKTLGRDIKNGQMDHKNAARNFLHATHMIAPNEFTASCLMDKYDVEGLYGGRLAITGYPRIDATLNDSPKEYLRERLGIPKGERVVLYAPTWRGSLANRALDEERVISDVSRLADGDWHFLYRGHSMTNNLSETGPLDEHSVPADIDTNDLLSIVDVLITDYSSIFFDFMATGKPIVYYAYDLEEYSQERGLYFDMEALPGQLCSSIEDSVKAVENALRAWVGPDQCYKSGQERFCSMEDGNSSQRAVDFFFFGDASFDRPKTQNGKTNILFYQGSFMPNGITTSYLNLTAHLDPDEVNIYTVVDPEALGSEERRLEKFAERPGNVRVLARVGHHIATPEERWVIDRFNSRRKLDTPEMWAIFHRAFKREFRRVFGDSHFDTVVCFEGYARFWAALLANPMNPGARKVIYLHNDMVREWRSRFGYLEGIFRLYNGYDVLVSVTESVNDENKLHLAELFGLPENRFTHCNNMVDPQETLLKAAEPIDADIEAWLENSGKVFVTLGRLSPEKGHAKLLMGFKKVVAEQPDARLVVLGDGPLRDDLDQLLHELNLEQNVLLAGLRMNPFAVLRAADCFVFSSDYEGQGLVLLESLILDKPTISTDVVGPRSVLKDGLGLLVPNSADGLAHGMLDYIEGRLPPFKTFNANDYNGESLERFLTLTQADVPGIGRLTKIGD